MVQETLLDVWTQHFYYNCYDFSALLVIRNLLVIPNINEHTSYFVVFHLIVGMYLHMYNWYHILEKYEYNLQYITSTSGT